MLRTGTSPQEDASLLTSALRRGDSTTTAGAERTAAIAFRLEKKRVLMACLKNLGVDYGVAGSSSGSGGMQQQAAAAKAAGPGKGFA